MKNKALFNDRAFGPEGNGRSWRRHLGKRVLSALMALNLLMNSMAFASAENIIYSNDVDPEVTEISGMAYGDGADAIPKGSAYVYPMGESGAVLLSTVIAQTGVPVSMNDIVDVAALGGADQGIGNAGDELISVVPVENDYTIFALRPFARAGLAIYTNSQVYTVTLTDSTAVDPAAQEVSGLSTEFQTDVVEKGEPQGDSYICSLGGAGQIWLSSVLSAVGLPLAYEEIDMVGLLGGGD